MPLTSRFLFAAPKTAWTKGLRPPAPHLPRSELTPTTTASSEISAFLRNRRNGPRAPGMVSVLAASLREIPHLSTLAQTVPLPARARSRSQAARADAGLRLEVG